MIVNIGLLVLLLGGTLTTWLFYKANDNDVDSDNRVFCGLFGGLIAIASIIAIIAFFAQDITVDLSSLIQIKTAPTTSQQYNDLTCK